MFGWCQYLERSNIQWVIFYSLISWLRPKFLNNHGNFMANENQSSSWTGMFSKLKFLTLCRGDRHITALFTYRSDSRFEPSKWKTVLICNDVSHWLGANLETALYIYCIYWIHWNQGLVMVLTLSSRVAHEAVVMTTYDVDNFTILNTLRFRCISN